jgi:hypothetical protein
VILYRTSTFALPALAGGFVSGWIFATENETPSPQADPNSRTDGVATGGDGPPASLSTVTVPRALLALSAALAVLADVAAHRRSLVFTPDSVVVHATRDAALIAVRFVLIWIGLRRASRNWFG